MSLRRISPMLSTFASGSVCLSSPLHLTLYPILPFFPPLPPLFLSFSFFLFSLSLSLCLSHSLLFPVPEPSHPFSLFSFDCFCLSASLCVRESLIVASGLLHAKSIFIYYYIYSSALRLVHY